MPICLRAVLWTTAPVLAALASLAAAPRPLSAQCGADPSCTAEPPTVVVTPSGGSWSGSTATRALPVTIQWCGEGISPSGKRVLLDGGGVTAQFHDAALVGGCFTSSDTLSLSPGSHSLVAEMQTPGGLTGSASAAYSYTYTGGGSAGPDVDVSPAAEAVRRGVGQPATERFTVVNTGSAAASFTLTGVCAGAATGCVVSDASVSLAGGGAVQVGVSYRASSTVGGTGTVRLRAVQSGQTAVRDSGTYALTTASIPAAGMPGDRSAGGTVERGMCLTIAAGAGAAYECGDLRLAHALPAVRLLNRAWAPVLVYNSQHARPHPVVATAYNPPGSVAPLSVRLDVSVATPAGPVVHSGTFAGWTPGSSKRLALGFDAADLPTGVYAYKVSAFNSYADGSTKTVGLGSGTLVVVNRVAAPFGAGWWVAGVEQLHPQADGSVLWVGGDGSARVYQRLSDTTWAAAPFERPDTLRLRGGRYVRTLPGKVEVRFGTSGQHLETVNRLGQRTAFTWTGERLTRIDLPKAGYAYTFGYNAAGRANQITSPGPEGTTRITRLSFDASGRVGWIRDPSADTVRFAYGDATARVTRRTDRMGRPADFRYGDGWRLRSVRLDVTRGDTSGIDSLVTRFRPAETQALADSSAVGTGRVYTKLDGPRSDVGDTTAFHLDRWGAPVRIRNALGHETRLARGDPQWPALVTRTSAPNGRVVRATYDARGNLAASVDSATSPAAVTLYEWDAEWDAVTGVTLPEGEVTRRGYTATGEVAWVQPGNDPARRTTFGYNGAGQVTTVRHPDGSTETYEYDARGNLSAAWSPLGSVSRFHGDALGRDTLSTTPAGTATRTVYDAADRVERTVTFGGGDTITVVNEYDAEDRPLVVTRSVAPDSNRVGQMWTRWGYDEAGRRVWEQRGDYNIENTLYNEGGLPVRVRGRRRDELAGGQRHVVTMDYDVLGRLVQRELPPAQYRFTSEERYYRTWSHPSRPLSPGAAGDLAYAVPGDVARFTYDVMGNVLTATNRESSVRRVYDLRGLVVADTLRIRTVNGTDLSQHDYGLRYTYDRNGRRTSLEHPGTLASGVGSADRKNLYTYDPETGALASVRDLTGNLFRFRYNTQGQLETLVKPTGEQVAHRYDADGRLVRRRGATALEDDSIGYDAAGRVTYARSGFLNTHSQFLPLGPMRQTSTGIVESNILRPDGLGFVRSQQRKGFSETGPTPWVLEAFIYQHGTGRLLASATRQLGDDKPVEDWRHGYDEEGNRAFTTGAVITSGGGNENVPIDPGGLSTYAMEWIEESTRHYYDASQRLRFVDRQRCKVRDEYDVQTRCDSWDNATQAPGSLFEEYRYDALGRRILKYGRTPLEECPGYTNDCVQVVERTVWDGDQILWEVRSTSDALEDDAPYGGRAGRVGYTHGPGIDAPLSIVRAGLPGLDPARTILLHLNWRGMPDGGTFPDGSTVEGTLDLTAYKWPVQSMTSYFRGAPPQEEPVWLGSIVTGQKDASGLFYRRNRYYDPQANQFTQEDPIGIAGGLNTYGFGGGDPVTYSDPYGLSPSDIIIQGERSRAIIQYLRNHSPTFDRVFRALDSDHSIRLVVRDLEGDEAQLYGSTRFSPPIRAGASGNIIYDPSENREANEDYARRYGSRFSWRFTPMSSMAHEFGHAAGYYGKGGVDAECRRDPAPGGTGCVINFENAVRRELPERMRGGERTFY
jgi:RHS repeat-associated protein